MDKTIQPMTEITKLNLSDAQSFNGSWRIRMAIDLLLEYLMQFEKGGVEDISSDDEPLETLLKTKSEE
jgi:hypothetical protein